MFFYFILNVVECVFVCVRETLRSCFVPSTFFYTYHIECLMHVQNTKYILFIKLITHLETNLRDRFFKLN